MTFVPEIARPLSHGSHPNSNAAGRRREDDHNLVATAFHQTQDPINEDNLSPALGRTSIGMGVAYPLARRGRDGESELELGEANVYNALRAGDGGSSRLNQVLTPEASVRRLTPVECERLQGWPDGWTDLGGTPDSKRYAACGDGVTAHVAEWIGRRLMAVST
jgi:DNA (cytosine-5)-methyltransferase 1